jgi:hypothetical protein
MLYELQKGTVLTLTFKNCVKSQEKGIKRANIIWQGEELGQKAFQI